MFETTGCCVKSEFYSLLFQMSPGQVLTCRAAGWPNKQRNCSAATRPLVSTWTGDSWKCFVHSAYKICSDVTISAHFFSARLAKLRWRITPRILSLCMYSASFPKIFLDAYLLSVISLRVLAAVADRLKYDFLFRNKQFLKMIVRSMIRNLNYNSWSWILKDYFAGDKTLGQTLLDQCWRWWSQR